MLTSGTNNIQLAAFTSASLVYRQSLKWIESTHLLHQASVNPLRVLLIYSREKIKCEDFMNHLYQEF